MSNDTSLFMKKITVKHHWLFTLGLLFFAAFSSPLRAEETMNKIVGNSATYELIGRYDVARLNKILTTEIADFTSLPITYTPAKNAVKLYRVSYPSVIPERGNKPIMASGLVAIPDTGEKAFPVVSYQHGTVYKKHEVPSFPDESMETRLMLAQFAGQGYVVMGADYFGMGLSTEKQGFVVKSSQQQACLDLYFSALKILDLEKIRMTDFFVAGWSQGGYVTMAFLEKLESLGIPVRATATASAPADGFVLVNSVLNFPRKIDAPWLTTILTLIGFSFEEYYNIPGLAQSLINPDQYDIAHKFYMDEPFTTSDFPTDLHKLIRPEYFNTQYLAESMFGKLLKDNATTYRWIFKTPMRNYYGDIDEAVTIGLAKLPMTYQQAIGNNNVVAISAGAKANHRGTYAYAVAEEKKWFDSLLTH